MSTVAYVINLSPTVALQGDVPNRVWYGKNVSYDHLRVFGCKCFVHIPKNERSKLDVKCKECIFIGYGQDEFGYRCYDPIQRKLIRNRDVVFVEHQTIEEIEKMQGSNTQIDGDLIDFDPIPTTEDATHGDASQQDEDHEHVDEPGIIDNRVEANHDVISPQTGIERGEQTSLQEAVNQQPRRSTRE